MRHSEGFFNGADGLKLYYQSWQPKGESRASVVLIHGVGDHSGRYMNVVNPLLLSGYKVYALDQRGHGRSPGKRAYIDRWEQYREDLKAFLDTIVKQDSDRSIFLYGSSMGALIALDYLLHNPQESSGAIISGTPFEPTLGNPFLIALGRILTRIWPRFSANSGIVSSLVTRDQAVQEADENDPLLSRKVTARWFIEFLDAVSRVKAHAHKISQPILVIHGEDDRLVRVQGARDLYEALPHNDKTLRIYPGGYHEPHNDLDREQVLADVIHWLDQHSKE